MTEQVREIMTTDVVLCPADATLTDAAQIMRDRDIGDVLVERDGQLVGVVTDRDIVVRGLAVNPDPAATPLGRICSGELVTVGPTESVDRVLELMQDNALRRVPVVDGARAVGIVSLGDLALARNPESVLGRISRSPGNT